MKILGLKLTHDGGLALIDDGRLIFSYEMEKINNSPRLEKFNLSVQQVDDMLKRYGYTLETLDEIVVDGWTNIDLYRKNELDKTTIKNIQLSTNLYTDITLAKYGMLISRNDNILAAHTGRLDVINLSYSSYMHVTGHFFSAYCTSPYAESLQDSFVLIWDGGMPPQLFHYQAKCRHVTNIGSLFLFPGHIYTGFAHEFSPFDDTEIHHYSVAGKLMAYVALGTVNDDLMSLFNTIYGDLIEQLGDEVYTKSIEWVAQGFVIKAKAVCISSGLSNEDILCTFHFFLQNLIVKNLRNMIANSGFEQTNICIAGGCGLSIKWNSAIRDSAIFKNVWVPPFPNDSGSAVGTACSAMVVKTNRHHLDWTVYSGPSIVNNGKDNDEYFEDRCTIQELAKILYEKREPVVLLNGEAELGPRALGNRSLISVANCDKMKAILNKVKGREDYRPVAPICLESDAPLLFNPGNPDPYMLFEHQVRDEWKDKIPAVVHIDGSARLQTISKEDNLTVFELLTSYKLLSGLSVLCNTSANFNGRGFFPDVASAMEWGELNYIWCDNTLYTKKNPMTFLSRDE